MLLVISTILNLLLREMEKKKKKEEEEERSGEKRNITEQVKGLYSSYRGHVVFTC